MSVVILGGGISGLSAAYYLLKHTPFKVTILEASSRVGGWIRSNFNKGHLFEQGPRTIRPKDEPGMNTLNLIEELQLTDKVRFISRSHPAAKNRYIYVNGQMCTVPSSIKPFFITTPPFSKPLITTVFRDLWTAPEIKEDDTVYNFFLRRFGQEIADYIFSPLICGVCAGDAKQISVNFLFKEFFEKEQKYGSVVKGVYKERNNLFPKPNTIPGTLPARARIEKWNTYWIDGGLEWLPAALESFITQNGGKISFNSACESLDLDNNTLKTSNGEEINYDHVMCSLPTCMLGSLISNHQSIVEPLQSIPYVNVVTVNLAYDENLLKEVGFGFLVPPMENLPLLGVTYDSCILDKTNTVVTVMMGGYAFEKYFGTSPTEDFLLNTALEHVKNILKISKKPDAYAVSVLLNCIPQYIVGHKKIVENVTKYVENNKLPLSLIGSAYNGIGINDVIMTSKNAVEKFMKSELPSKFMKSDLSSDKVKAVQ